MGKKRNVSHHLISLIKRRVKNITKPLFCRFLGRAFLPHKKSSAFKEGHRNLVQIYAFTEDYRHPQREVTDFKNFDEQLFLTPPW